VPVPPKKEARRDPARPATIKPKKAPTTITAAEHVVIADAVRLLGWGKQWHEIADAIGGSVDRALFTESYSTVFEGDERWRPFLVGADWDESTLE